MKISVSAGTSKTGDIPSFNLPPIESCPNHATCASFKHKGKKWSCYAIRSFNQYPDVKRAWSRNFAMCLKSIAQVEWQLANHFRRSVVGYFRIHSSGDFYSKEYLDMWIRIARKFPEINFLAYTKMYGYFKDLVLPDNFTVFASFMPQITFDAALKVANYYKLPLAYAYGLNVEDVPDTNHKMITCPDQVVKAKHPKIDRLTCAGCKLCWRWSTKVPSNVHLRFIIHR